MKCEVVIDRNVEEKVVIYAKAETPIVRDIQQLAASDAVELLGYRDKEMVKLQPSEITCVTVMDGKVYAVCDSETLQLKERLYVLEERLPENFVKIHQSCIANFQKITRFDASISGTLRLRFQNGYTDFVSRRQLKHIKERMGL